jgi:carboxylesterase type B
LDQWLALHWIQDHISAFGGDPTKVTIAGESDGATNVGLHITAYGGNTKYPFQQAIMESGATSADVDISNGFSANNTAAVIKAVNCTSSSGNSKAEMSCLRALPLETLLTVAVAYEKSLNPLSFDVFKTCSPDPFIPDAPSHLLASGRFRHNTKIITGWNENDGTLFATPTIQTDADLRAFVESQFPLDAAQTETLLNLYPVSEYIADPAENISAQYFAAAAMERDGFTCPSILLVDKMAQYSASNTSSYLYALNVSAFTPFFAQVDASYLGISHFSDIPFVFGQVDSGPLAGLDAQISGGWAAFATHGDPSRAKGLDAWAAMDRGGKTNVERYNLRILGGPRDGQTFIGSKNGSSGYGENIAKKCAFWNSQEVLDQLGQ